MKLEWTEADAKKGMCGCKLNKDESGVFCDGSHRFLPEDISKEKVGFQREPAWKNWMESEKEKAKSMQ